jgi:hypothetical protein
LSPLNPHRLAELSIPSLHQLAEELPAVAGLLLKNESKQDSSPPYDAAEAEEPRHQEAVEAVEAEEEAEERRLLRSPRPPLRQLCLKQPTSELWGRPHEYSREIEPKQKISLTNYDTITASTEEWLDSTLL